MIKRQPQPAAQGGSVLVDNTCPPTTTFANRHLDPTRSGHRQHAAAANPSIATSAADSSSALNHGPVPDTATVAATNPATNKPARARNRRRQSRTVVCGTPTRTATVRAPTPAAIAAIASPITSTPSKRPYVTNSGTRPCERPHGAHRTRLTHNRVTSPTRTSRRYQPHNIIAVEHDGHTGRGTTTSRPAAAYASTSNRVRHTIATGPQALSGPSRGRVQRLREGPHRVQRPAIMPRPTTPPRRTDPDTVPKDPCRSGPHRHHQVMPVTPGHHRRCTSYRATSLCRTV